jgi:hypothetical protein
MSQRNFLRSLAMPKPMKKPKLDLTTNLMNEVIIYGGVPMRRADVYRDALTETGSRKAADMFAFGPNTKVAPPGTIPVSLKQNRKWKHSKR